MKRKFKVGDSVSWESSSAGIKALKFGKVIEVVPCFTMPRTKKTDVGQPRPNESYVVEGGFIREDGYPSVKRLYWPHASKLRLSDSDQYKQLVDKIRKSETLIVFRAEFKKTEVKIPVICPSCNADLSKPESLVEENYMAVDQTCRVDSGGKIDYEETTIKDFPESQYPTGYKCNGCGVYLVTSNIRTSS
jgi:hypothetical protein